MMQNHENKEEKPISLHPLLDRKYADMKYPLSNRTFQTFQMVMIAVILLFIAVVVILALLAPPVPNNVAEVNRFFNDAMKTSAATSQP